MDFNEFTMTNHPQIIGIGIAALDVLLRLRTMPTWEATSPLVDLSLDGGGPVASAMVASARLGARVGFIDTKQPSIHVSAGFGELPAVGPYLKFIEERQADLMKVVSEVISLDGVPDAFERLLNPHDEVKILVGFE